MLISPRTPAPVLLALSLVIVASTSRLGAAEGPVAALPPHLAESGIPTQAEVLLVKNWLATIAAAREGRPPAQAWLEQWLGTALPFRFRYDGRGFAGPAMAGSSNRANSAARPTSKARTGRDFPMELAKRQVKLYKRVRPYLSGDFYPLTDCTLDCPWLAYQFHRNDLDGGFALIFKRKATESNTFAFAPRGLDPQARYVISCQGSGGGGVYTGAALAKGLPLTLPATPEAELVIYEKQP